MRTKRTCKLLSWILALALLLGMLPVAALATGEDAHVHEQPGFAEDGSYYTGSCVLTPGGTTISETPDLCPVPALVAEHVHDAACSTEGTEDYALCPVAAEAAGHICGEACYPVTTTEEAWTCESYPYFTVTFEDTVNGNAAATARLVPAASQYSEPAPAFAAAHGAAPLVWADVDGNAVDLAALTADATVYAVWEAVAELPSDLPPALSAGANGEDTEPVTKTITGATARTEQGTNLKSSVGEVTFTAAPGARITRDTLSVPSVTSDGWDFLYNGGIEVEQTLGVWRSVDFFTLSSDDKLYAHFGNDGDSATEVVIGGHWEGIPMLSLWSGDLRFYFDWPFSFYDLGDATDGVEYAYSLDGQTITPLTKGDTLYLYNNGEALKRVEGLNPTATIRLFDASQGIVFFAKAAQGYMPITGSGKLDVTMGNQKGDVYALDESPEKDAYATLFTSAAKQGYTSEFHFHSFNSNWDDGEGRRGFRMTSQADTTEYTVTYRPGAENTTGDTAAQSGTWNTALEISPCGFVNRGYEFVDWTDTQGNHYAPGDHYYIKGQNLELTANWQQSTTTEVKLEYYVKDGAKYSLTTREDLAGKTAQVSGTQPTEEAVLALQDTYAVPMEETLGMGAGNNGKLYHALKRVEAVKDANNGWTLRYYYNSIQFYVNTNGIPGGQSGTFTNHFKIPGTVGGVTWDAKDHSDQNSRQYAGGIYSFDTDVTTEGVTLDHLDGAGIDAATKEKGKDYGTYGQDYTVIWYSVHEGYYIHVDGYVKLLKTTPVITYHSNYPADADMALVEKNFEAVENDPLWKHTFLSNTDERVGIVAPDGYTFAGWKDGAGNLYRMDQTVDISANVDVFAQWNKNSPPVTAKYTVTYLPGDHGSFEGKIFSEIAANTATPAFDGSLESKTPGYQFKGWDPAVAETVTADATYTAQWEKTDAFDYRVEWYYQSADGTYPTVATASATRSGTRLGQEVSVLDTDKNPTAGESGATYRLNEGKSLFTGTIAAPVPDQGFPGLVLKIYFDRQYTVTYQPGDHGIAAAFEGQSFKAFGGDNTPLFKDGATPVSKDGGYQFIGWAPALAPQVTGDATYVAQWAATSSFNYTVEYYYQQNDGAYLDATSDTQVYGGSYTGQEVSASTADKTPKTVEGATYVLDAGRADGWNSTVGGAPVKVYFKLQFTVTYEPGLYGSFDVQSTAGLDYGAEVPAFVGQTSTNSGSYTFSGWAPAHTGPVTSNLTFVAQWVYDGGEDFPDNPGDGGGGYPDNPGDGGDNETEIPEEDTPLDPGPGTDETPDATIPDEDVPLNPQPDDVEIPEENVPLDPGPAPGEDIIVDEDVPLGNLPQTGVVAQPGDPTITLGLMALAISLSAAGLSVLIYRKREQEGQ